MRHVRQAVDIDAPTEMVWHLITEFDRWPEWGPTVRRVEADARHVAVGVTGRVQTPVGMWLPFEITTVVPGRAWDWKVAGIAATGHRLDRTGASSCRLEFSVPWAAVPYMVVLRRALHRVKHLAESASTRNG